MPSSTLLDRHLRIPKYLQLAEYLRERISDGQLQPDDRLPSFNDMKAQFDATQRTVEKAHALLENDGLIRREPGRGVFVNHPAPRKKTGNVGFVLPHSMQPERDLTYWGLVLSGFRQAVRDRNYHLLLIDESNAMEPWDKMDAVVLCNTRDPRNHEPLLPTPPPGFPGITIFNEMPGKASITVDDFAGAYQLAQHLIQLGHRRIAYLGTSNVGISQLDRRQEGYLAALRDANIEPDPRWIRDVRKRSEWIGHPYWYPLAGEYYVRRWLAEDWKSSGCTALITQNDATAKGAINAFESAGLEVPRHISVTGFDGLPTYADSKPLTTMQAPLFEVGRLAVKSLLDWLEDPRQMPQSLCLPVSFVQGLTTAPPPQTTD